MCISPKVVVILLIDMLIFWYSDLSDSLKSYRYLSRASSPLATTDVTQRVRQESLINRYNDVFSIDRLNAMDTLGRYQSDYEMNQRICNAVIQVCLSCLSFLLL